MKFFGVSGSKPKKIKLKKGETCYLCTCGLSENSPFCDGAHAGTDFTSLSYTANKNECLLMCSCKNSSTMPFCDGCLAENGSKNNLEKNTIQI